MHAAISTLLFASVTVTALPSSDDVPSACTTSWKGGFCGGCVLTVKGNHHCYPTWSKEVCQRYEPKGYTWCGDYVTEDEVACDSRGLLRLDVKDGLKGTNYCEGTMVHLPNIPCFDADDVVQAVEQSGRDISDVEAGSLAATGKPITKPFWEAGLCAVNVHFHEGAEHRSAGQYDEDGTGPADSVAERRKRAAKKGEKVRKGLQCHLYDENDERFTTEYVWKHCEGMHVGRTYEVHWPSSSRGACGTPHQFQSPFYDGLFCNSDKKPFTNLAQEIGVQGQVFTIVNDEDYYYNNLMNGMIVDGPYGKNLAIYTGSSTGTSRNNEKCSQYGPITWQVDRDCQLISASTFDKMCADMKMQRDDMSSDLYPHGSREVVLDELSADNLEFRTKLGL